MREAVNKMTDTNANTVDTVNSAATAKPVKQRMLEQDIAKGIAIILVMAP